MSALGPSRPRVVALYLPHFYPIAENAAGKGPGFTDWRLVAQAEALFPGHDQPRRPADLGYCDLRVPEVRLAQADLARAYGVDAFCYCHYWSLGRRLFERPFAEVLASGEPDFPFCLCWVNESWAAGGFSQGYSPADDLAHAAFLAEAFADRRYLKVDGRPIFVVRRPEELAASGSTLGAIREAARRRGAGDPLLVGACGEPCSREPRAVGLDVMLDWPLPAGMLEHRDPPIPLDLDSKLRHLVRHRRWLPELRVEEERRARARADERLLPDGRIPLAVVGWDDTPRQGRLGTVLEERAPGLFEHALRRALVEAKRGPESDSMVFIFAWNAWVEGAALEPDERFGRAYLEAVARARVAGIKTTASRGEPAR